MKELLNNKKTLLIALVILAQVGILFGEYLNSVYPLWYGETVKLAIRPVDPRSLFRGQYVLLNYDISRIDSNDVDRIDEYVLRQGQIFYVGLKQGDDGLWGLDRAYLEKPDKGLFIRGRLSQRNRSWSNPGFLRLRYGIEAYFASPKRAKELERGVRTRTQGAVKGPAIAEIKIAPNGKAALVEIFT